MTAKQAVACGVWCQVDVYIGWGVEREETDEGKQEEEEEEEEEGM